MHSLKVIKTVSADAMDDDDPGAEGLFRSIVGPTTVLEMAEIIEALLAHIEKAGTGEELVRETRKVLAGGFESPAEDEPE